MFRTALPLRVDTLVSAADQCRLLVDEAKGRLTEDLVYLGGEHLRREWLL